jgi:adenylate cyclase
MYTGDDPRASKVLETKSVSNDLKSSDIASELEKKLHDTISFVGTPEKYCVGVVDMVNSTKVASKLNYENSCLLYAIFLNSMSFIVEQFEGKVIKNVGDALLYYFPKTTNHQNGEFEKVLLCGKVMINSHQQVAEALKKNNLPSIRYRITSDYGTILMADSKTSFNKDLYGSPVNACFKMKSLTEPNSMSIGSDFYQFVKNSTNFNFNNSGTCDLGIAHGYPVFQVVPKIKQMQNSNLN